VVPRRPGDYYFGSTMGESMDDLVQRKELAAFLRSRREATDPRDVGLQPGKQRRTPGLRREELAGLSGVSVTWYTWLEQGRDISVSRKVIDSLARVLRISPTEQAHMYTLAGLRVPAQDVSVPALDPAMAQLVTALQPNPASVINPWWDLLTYNKAYSELFGGLDRVAAEERNVLRIAFSRVLSDGMLTNWDAVVSDLVGQLRNHIARFPHDPRGPALVTQLRELSPEFRRMWDDHVVNRFHTSTVVLHHPQVGRLELNFIKLTTADDESQQLVVYLPADAASESALERLT
jgi:transcriptional regulator with XRE-family HTH domain